MRPPRLLGAAPHSDHIAGGATIVIVTFTGDSVEKILAGRKCGTTRLPSRMWQRVVRHLAEGRKVDAHIYRGNPRNGGVELYRAPFVRGVLCTGREFDEEMVLKDGFLQKEDLALRLWRHYNRGKATLPAALKWMNAEVWTWFEWELPPTMIEVEQDQQAELPLIA